MNSKKCKQCGKWKSIDDFRKYSNRNGTHTMCRSCESINTARIRLEKKVQSGAATDDEQETLNKIYKLYDVQRSRGLEPPAIVSSASLSAQLDSALAEYEHQALTGEAELREWLTKDLSSIDLAADEDYLDNVMAELDKKYRPVVGRDEFTLKPIYDETYKDLLNGISERFDKYTEEFWNGLE